MAQSRTHESVRVKEKKSVRERSKGSFTAYIDDITDPEELTITDEDSLDEPPESYEESEDENSGDDYGAAVSTGIQPLWILCGGQILWAASRYGFNLAPKEYFRRRIQILLDFLAKKFPRKSYGELLLSLQGFFAKDSSSSKGGWLDSLKNSGILYFDEEKKKYELMPIGNLRAGKGQGKGKELPKQLESLWLEHELSKIGHHDNEKMKARLIEDFKKFCAELNDLCSVFDSQEEEEAVKGEKIYGIGLKKIEFAYEESSLDRKKILEWKNEHGKN